MHEIWIRFEGTSEEAVLAYDYLTLMVHQFMWPDGVPDVEMTYAGGIDD